MTLTLSRRTIVLTVILLLVWGTLRAQAPERYIITRGRITANDQEREGCMFAIGQWTFLVLHPKGEPCVLVTHELNGKYIRLEAVVEDVR